MIKFMYDLMLRYELLLLSKVGICVVCFFIYDDYLFIYCDFQNLFSTTKNQIELIWG